MQSFKLSRTLHQTPMYDFSSNYSKTKLKPSHRPDSTDSETFPGEISNISNDTNTSLRYSEEEINGLQPRPLYKHRPYSSVKYNRKITNSGENDIDYPAYSYTVECQVYSDDMIFYSERTVV